MAAEIETTATSDRARIVGIDIPFWDLVILLVKLSMAAIPAVIILAMLGVLVGGVGVGLIDLVRGFIHAH